MGGKFSLPAQTAKNEWVKTGQHSTGKYMGNPEVQKINYSALILFSTKYSRFTKIKIEVETGQDELIAHCSHVTSHMIKAIFLLLCH